MNRTEILSLLEQHREEIKQDFAVKHIALFGSAARNELRDDSDIDVLVEFSGPSTFDGYFNLKDYLEKLLGRPIDLVTNKGLKPRARHNVERVLVHVA